jgi:hypothetical protein
MSTHSDPQGESTCLGNALSHSSRDSAHPRGLQQLLPRGDVKRSCHQWGEAVYSSVEKKQAGTLNVSKNRYLSEDEYLWEMP